MSMYLDLCNLCIIYTSMYLHLDIYVSVSMLMYLYLCIYVYVIYVCMCVCIHPSVHPTIPSIYPLISEPQSPNKCVTFEYFISFSCLNQMRGPSGQVTPTLGCQHGATGAHRSILRSPPTPPPQHFHYITIGFI